MIAIQGGIAAAITAQMTALWWWWWWWYGWGVGGGYKGNVKSVLLAAPVLTWGSPALSGALGLSAIWRNPGGVGLIVGNYGNDCVL